MCAICVYEWRLWLRGLCLFCRRPRDLCRWFHKQGLACLSRARLWSAAQHVPRPVPTRRGTSWRDSTPSWSPARRPSTECRPSATKNVSQTFVFIKFIGLIFWKYFCSSQHQRRSIIIILIIFFAELFSEGWGLWRYLPKV